MDNTLTINSKTFAYRYADFDRGSERVNIAPGLNIPEKMYVKNQSYVDGKTSRPATRRTLIHAKHLALADGTIAESVRVTMKVEFLEDTNVSSAVLLDMLENVIGTIQEDDSGLNLGEAIFVKGEL